MMAWRWLKTIFARLLAVDVFRPVRFLWTAAYWYALRRIPCTPGTHLWVFISGGGVGLCARCDQFHYVGARGRSSGRIDTARATRRDLRNSKKNVDVATAECRREAKRLRAERRKARGKTRRGEEGRKRGM